MKFAFVIVLGFFASASLASAAPSDLVGNWIYTDRTCASGAVVDAASGPLEMIPKLNYSPTFALTITFDPIPKNPCTYKLGPVAQAVTDTTMTPLAEEVVVTITCEDGTRREERTAGGPPVGYVIKGDKLTISNVVSEETDICPAGDVVQLNYVRAQ